MNLSNLLSDSTTPNTDGFSSVNSKTKFVQATPVEESPAKKQKVATKDNGSKQTGSDPLDMIGNMMQRKQLNQKQDSEIMKKKAYSQAAESLIHHLLSISQYKQHKDLEVEIRLGKFFGEAFRAGVTHDEFEQICRAYNSDPNYTSTFLEETDYLFEKPNNSNFRITYDDKEKKTLGSEIKTRHGNAEFRMNESAFDCRLSVSTETPIEADPDMPISDNYNCKRHKNRFTYTHKDPKFPWKVDATVVKASFKNGSDSTLYEIEYELSPMAVQLSKAADQKAVLDISVAFYKEMRNLTSKMKTATEAHVFEEINMVKVEDREELMNLRQRCNTWFPGMSPESQDFPGSMPVNFSRRHVRTVQETKFYVSEKTDGIRFLLMVDEECGIFMVDRKFDFYLIHGFDLLLDLYGKKGTTILDGEMVRHVGTKKLMYLVFDILVVDGIPCADKTLTERLSKIFNSIVTPFRGASAAAGANQSAFPFTLIGKLFTDKRDMRKLKESIHMEGAERIFQDEHRKRKHKTDGVILTPDEPYKSKTVPNLYKWKYVDKLSIDFRVDYRGNKQIFTCVGPEGRDIEYPLKLRQEDLMRIQQDISRQRDPNNIIIECSYDSWHGNWNYCILRTDKRKANHISVVFDTLETISENVSIEELAYRLPLDPSHDDWIHQMNKSYRAILDNKGHKPEDAQKTTNSLPKSGHH
eukprot:TRINITY_DN3967_c0_g1_i1.p1 TRINITY_DN3967_c0_g1~~TRINITY_DN3967_c0_g1_i1.p1  ORF type:complete len:695 (+),score=174.20 TRINITY_DN3967_c0_g1_i1:138-2222(+)